MAGKLAKWGMRTPEALEALVGQLVATVVTDGGRHISLHLAEQDGQILVPAFSHRPHPSQLEAGFLARLRDVGAVSCGTEMTAEGRPVWAVLGLPRSPA
ncbi:hypothetical protein [Streptomyces flavidovirens]